MTTCYVGLSSKQAIKLKKLASAKGTSESAALRVIIEQYLKQDRKKGKRYYVCQKTSPDARKVKPRTISKEQDKALRKLAEKTGRSISELVRGAVESYVEQMG